MKIPPGTWSHVGRFVRIVAYTLATSAPVSALASTGSVSGRALTGAVVAALVAADVAAFKP